MTLSSSRGLTRTTIPFISGREASEIALLARSLISQSGDPQAYPTRHDHHHASDIYSYMMPAMVMLFGAIATQGSALYINKQLATKGQISDLYLAMLHAIMQLM